MPMFACGGVPERSKGADCKSADSVFEGSNPSPSTMTNKTMSGHRIMVLTQAFQACDAGSIPAARSIMLIFFIVNQLWYIAYSYH